MIEPQPISPWNTGLPLVALGALALLVPRLLVRRDTRSHWHVAVAIWASAGIMLLLAAAVFALSYAAQGADLAAAWQASALGTVAFFLRLAGYSALVWGPLLALVWFALAQRVERLKGEDVARHE